MWELVEQGGWMMYPLLLTSIVALAIILERTYVVLVRTRPLAPQSQTRLYDLIKTGKRDDGYALLEQGDSSFDPVFLAILSESDEGHQEKAAVLAGDELLFGLRRRLSILSAIGTLAPLMGLLGTVLGMIEVFADVANLGDAADPAMLAGGIWEALLTTAMGMTIAIPALTAYHYLHRHIGEIAHALQHEGSSLIALLNRCGLHGISHD